MKKIQVIGTVQQVEAYINEFWPARLKLTDCINANTEEDIKDNIYMEIEPAQAREYGALLGEKVRLHLLIKEEVLSVKTSYSLENKA